MTTTSDRPFHTALVRQIQSEFHASQQYIAIAVHYDSQTLPQLARRFYAQAAEEHQHAMMMVQYLLDADVAFDIPGVEAVTNSFADFSAPVALALEQEKQVSDQIVALARTARDAGDYLGEQFMQWFLKEQVEEVASMTDLLQVIDHSAGNILQVEEFLSRQPGEGPDPDPTAPKAAGG